MTDKQFDEFFNSLHETTGEHKVTNTQYYLSQVNHQCNDIIAYKIAMGNRIAAYSGYLMRREDIERLYKNNNFVKIDTKPLDVFGIEHKDCEMSYEDFLLNSEGTNE